MIDEDGKAITFLNLEEKDPFLFIGSLPRKGGTA